MGGDDMPLTLDALRSALQTSLQNQQLNLPLSLLQSADIDLLAAEYFLSLIHI